MKNWKLLLVCVSFIAALCSCADVKPDDSKTTFQVSSQNKQHWEPTYDSLGNAGDQKLVDDSVAIIKPTWGQSIYYSKQSGDTIFKVIGIVSLLAFGFIILKLAHPTDGIQLSLGTGTLMVILLGGFIAGFWGKAASIKGNNTKEIKISVYRSSLAQFGDTKPIWDTLYLNSHLNWAAPSK